MKGAGEKRHCPTCIDFLNALLVEAIWRTIFRIMAAPKKREKLRAISTSPQLMRYRLPTKTDSTDRRILIRTVKKGLPISTFEQLQADIGVSAHTIAAVTHVALRTLTRRRKEGRFHVDESERLLRLGLLFTKAQEVLRGRENARVWFTSPKIALGGKSPLAYADTELGAREVEDLLGRLEHGVFS
jgi:putative toxin-antitoxin system antitoxin component (TIGR02293 family)